LLPLLFDWDAANVERVARHGVSPDEIEDALLDPNRMGAEARNLHDERRFAYVGSTAQGRTLVVVTTWRRRRIRVVTGRDAGERERHRYRRQRTLQWENDDE
jgi:uncharacterized DUF497 family protein